MTLHEAYTKLLLDLKTIYDNREAANIADWVIEHVTGNKKVDRILNKNTALHSDQELKLIECSNQLLQHKPVQYVLNEAWFEGLKLYVDESVLIPRPETEELVDWIASDVRCTKYDVGGSMLDVGTGSGCIPIALKYKFPNADVSAIDVSENALKVAKRNAATYKLDINFINLNFLDKQQWKSLGVYDIIVSNPPYIKQSDEATMHQNVLAHEPHIALFVPDEDALVFYKALAEFSQKHLKENGKLFVEINEALGHQVVELFKQSGLKDVELRKDLQGKDRMVKCRDSDNES